ncbi:MAG: site-2 protease family protein [Gammaproteobacteria bacterium]|nr:site-2 protease family protein [Gammaproteobacteria bacterium]
MPDINQFLVTFSVWALPVIFAITVHEAAHGYVANYLGDPTARMLGRLSLNPVRHIDPVGTVLLPTILLLIGGFIFGWAKPVPVTVENLKNPKRDMAYVAAAGPLSNLLMALLWILLLKLSLLLAAGLPTVSQPLAQMSLAGITINLVLMLLNLLPIPPLDGGRIAVGILPSDLAWRFSRLEPYGLVIIVALLATGLLGRILGPLLFGTRKLLLSLVGL